MAPLLLWIYMVLVVITMTLMERETYHSQTILESNNVSQ
jgi:hypothetical protein